MHTTHLISNLRQLREVIPAPKDSPPAKLMQELDLAAIGFLACSPLVFVATTSRSHDVDVSPKGDKPGFAQVLDARTILLPERSGNRLAFGFQNILESGAIGLIFLVPHVRETLRVNGRAVLTKDPALLHRFIENGKPPLLVTQVSIDECFFHCGKALIRSSLWTPPQGDRSSAERAASRNWARQFSLSESQSR